MAIQEQNKNFDFSQTNLAFAVITVGISILAFSIPTTLSLTTELQREVSYATALTQEIEYNRDEANSVIDQYSKAKEIALPPSYSTKAYDAIIDAGALNMFSTNSSNKLIPLYAFISTWSDVYQTAQKDGAHVDDDILAVHAKLTKSDIQSFDSDIQFTNTTSEQASIFQKISISGMVFTFLGVLLLINIPRILVFKAYDLFIYFSKLFRIILKKNNKH